jgi:starch phosphorylase
LTGLVDPDGSLQDPVVIPMQLSEQQPSGTYLFQAVIQPTARSGLHGYAIRVLPNHPDSLGPFLLGLIKWATSESPVVELQAR